MWKWNNESMMHRSGLEPWPLDFRFTSLLHPAFFANGRYKSVWPRIGVFCVLNDKLQKQPLFLGLMPMQRQCQHLEAVSGLPCRPVGCVPTHQGLDLNSEVARLLLTQGFLGTRCHSCAYSEDNILVNIWMPLMVCLFSPKWTHQTVCAGA